MGNMQTASMCLHFVVFLFKSKKEHSFQFLAYLRIDFFNFIWNLFTHSPMKTYGIPFKLILF